MTQAAMYAPTADGFSLRGPAVRYTELAPPEDLSQLVHRFWELRTAAPLQQDFSYHALPDACVNLLFNLQDTRIAGITALHTEATTLNLGTSFHYVGVQLYPGVWQGDRNELVNRYVGAPYQGPLPLVQTSQQLVGLDFIAMSDVLATMVRGCMAQGLVQNNTVTACVLTHLDNIRSVADMAALLELSPRQVQRTIKRLTGFAPHDLLKVLRVQQSFRKHYLDLYADQAHFTHAFRQATGYTPVQYQKRFGV
jgi:AraC-like DNA-binding protein